MAEDILTTMDAVDEVVTAVQNEIKWNIGYLVVPAMLVAGAIGYKIGMKRATLKYEEQLGKEVQEAKEFYARLYKKDDYETPEAAAEALGSPAAAAEAVRRYQGESTPDLVIEDVQVNIFTEAEFDPEQELAKRAQNPDAPYVISREEYLAGDPGYSQASLTYYEEDDTLADETDRPITDVESTVGNDNLSRFGHGSGDVRVVYVRNDKEQIDFEITRSTGSYAGEVAGFKHSDRVSMRPSRRRDE